VRVMANVLSRPRWAWCLKGWRRLAQEFGVASESAEKAGAANPSNTKPSAAY
jgi:hypothetical protein